MITVVSKFSIKPDYIEIFKKVMLENQELVQQEEGNLEMRLFVEKNDPTSFFVYGRTRDQKALEVHTKLVEERRIAEKMKETLETSPTTWSLGETKPLPDHDSKQANSEDKEVIIFFVFDTKPGYKDKLVAQFEKHVTHTRKEEGNILFDFYTINDIDTKFVVYERWRNEDAVWKTHMGQEYSKETGGLINEIMLGEMEQYLHIVEEVK